MKKITKESAEGWCARLYAGYLILATGICLYLWMLVANAVEVISRAQ